LLAALGYVAVFAGASNTPLACTIMGVELFGSGALVYFAIACVISYVFSSHRSIYDSQRLAVRKYGTGDDEPTLRAIARARRYWLGGRSTPDDR
jgi:H+/Cl- antiporter ClcA